MLVTIASKLLEVVVEIIGSFIHFIPLFFGNSYSYTNASDRIVYDKFDNILGVNSASRELLLWITARPPLRCEVLEVESVTFT